MLYALPTGWEEFSTELLNAKLDEIAALAAKLDIDAAGSDDGPSGLEVAESLADAREAVQGVIDTRTAEAADATERREAALARLAPAPEPEVEETVEADDTAELAVEETVEEDPQPEPEAAPVEEAEVVEELAVAEEDPEPTPEPEAAPVVEAAAGLAKMSARRGAAELPQASESNAGALMTAADAAESEGFAIGSDIADIEVLSGLFADSINRLRTPGNSWEGARKTIPLARGGIAYAEDQILSASDVEANFRVFDAASNSWIEEQDALVAAGAPCAPLMPSYNFESCYAPQRPVEAGLPVVGAPRGGIRYLNPVPLNAESAGAITEKDAAASALLPGDAGYAAKNCTRVTCPTETSVTVGSINWCVTFDNLNFRVFPEQVANMLERVQIEFTKAKEIRYLNRIDQLAPAAIDIAAAQPNPFGAARSLYQDLKQAGHNYRKRNNLDKDQILDVWLPDVVEDVLAVDMTNDFDNGGMASIVGGAGGNLTSALMGKARMNVNFYYYDSTEAGFPASSHNEAAAAWNPFPTTFRSYIYKPGAIVRLDGGQLDLGVVRDSTLNADNDLQLFAEQWIEVAHVGCEILSLDHTFCYSGVGPAAVAAPACP